MTTMLPTDARCCPTGKATFQIDTASGRHWELVDAKPAAPAGRTGGPLSALPIVLGPYVGAREGCRTPSQVTWFEPGGFWEIADGSRFFYDVASVEREEDYYLLIARVDPNDPPPGPDEPEDGAVGVRPAGAGRIVMMIQDEVAMKLCKPEEIPARFRP